MSKQLWKIKDNKISWEVEQHTAHTDDIEMSGLYCDYIITYGVSTDGTLLLSQKCYFPTLRTIPNDTHATYCFDLAQAERIAFEVGGVPVTEYPVRFEFDGKLNITTKTDCGITINRTMFPSVDKMLAVEIIELTAEKDVTLKIPSENETVHSYGRGTKGVYVSKIYHTANNEIRLKNGEKSGFAVFYTSEIASKTLTLPNAKEELLKRNNRITELCDSALVLNSESLELNTMLRFAKLRAAESIFETATGKYHSPGGHAYYAAIWCNDEIEYAGPHFAMTGDATAIEASINAYRAYIPFMSDSYYRLPSSIIAEGLDIWEGAGDRGDAAMYLYGCSLFCLYLGDNSVATELYPAIKWCAEYCERKKSIEGVICSDSDELEGRFPTDKKANLSTSCLCYGGLVFASKLALSLGDVEYSNLLAQRAAELEQAIENYFGATLNGFKTYRYSKGFNTLRAWICLPLCMGITDRAEDTLNAMLSPYLWTEDGMLTCERGKENTSNTIWDRSTLYGMKCAFLCGAGDRMLRPLLDYCKKRLLCDRVPYAIEAYPEGDKRHLSGESALFVRVVTEGIFGIMPESINSFSFVPNVPNGLGNKLELKNLKICGACFDISVNKTDWLVTSGGKTVACGKTECKRVIINK